MELENWVSAVASIAAFGAVIIAFLTLLEIKRHRENSYKPTLAVPRARIFGYQEPWIGSKIPEFWLPEERPEEQSTREYRPSFYAISLHNIGLGAAVEVEVNWEFDSDAMIKHINENRPKEASRLQKEDLQYGWIKLSMGTDLDTLIDTGNILSEFSGFVLPDSVRPGGIHLVVPPLFVKLVSLAVGLLTQVIGTEEDSEFSLPEASLELRLRYNDIAGLKHEQTMHVKFQLIRRYESLGQDGDILVFQGLLLTTEKR